jgi:hypothetical protein
MERPRFSFGEAERVCREGAGRRDVERGGSRCVSAFFANTPIPPSALPICIPLANPPGRRVSASVGASGWFSRSRIGCAGRLLHRAPGAVDPIPSIRLDPTRRIASSETAEASGSDECADRHGSGRSASSESSVSSGDGRGPADASTCRASVAGPGRHTASRRISGVEPGLSRPRVDPSVARKRLRDGGLRAALPQEDKPRRVGLMVVKTRRPLMTQRGVGTKTKTGAAPNARSGPARPAAASLEVRPPAAPPARCSPPRRTGARPARKA